MLGYIVFHLLLLLLSTAFHVVARQRRTTMDLKMNSQGELMPIFVVPLRVPRINIKNPPHVPE